MQDALPGGPCEICDGTGTWQGGCELPDDCFQCHGTGIQRARGNCEACSGWGWTFGARKCTACRATGWTDDDIALYWCKQCRQTIASVPTAPDCPKGGGHAIARLTAAFRTGS